jgi:cytochrome c-type biogenesis protein CcmH
MFWIISIALIALAFAFILPPLLRQTSVLQDDRREQNISIAKQRLAELEAEFKQGNIGEIAYKASRLELEDALYQDLQDEETQKNTRSGSASKGLGQKSSAIIMTLLIPILAIGLYSQWGNIEAISESKVTAGDLSAKQQKQLASIDKMVKSLEDKLKSEPNNAKGWFMLGRTYMVMRRHSDAVQAYESANKYKPNDPEILLPLADALATISQGRLTGRPESLIKQALQVDPNDMMGLWLAGMAAEQRDAKLEAVNFWKKLQTMLVLDSEDYKEVTALITRASGTEPVVTAPSSTTAQTPIPTQVAPSATAQVNVPTQVAPSVAAQANVPAQVVPSIVVQTPNSDEVVNKGIRVKVILSEALKASVKPDDTVFIYAKAVTGPPMPLAAARKQVKDLPLELTLDDSMAMMPQMRISAFTEVKVGARVSLTGQPRAQTGDLFTEYSPVKMGESIVLEINQVVP